MGVLGSGSSNHTRGPSNLTQNLATMVSNNHLPTNLPQLQNLIKRDKESYKEEFMQQLRHFEASLHIFQLNPQAESKEFGELVTFLSHVRRASLQSDMHRYTRHSSDNSNIHTHTHSMQVVNLYPHIAVQFPTQLLGLLESHASVMQPETRRDLCKAVILLRGKDMVTPVK